MNKLMGIINDTQDDYFLKDLTLHRTLATVPFASRYRLVDFVLSNMVNSGINNVGILVKNKDCSLINYLGAAKEWGLDRKNGGLFFLSTANKGLNKGTVLDLVTLYNNLNYLEKSKEEYVLLATSQMICNMNYQKVLQAHISSKSDITLIYQEGKLAETKGAYLNIKNQDVIGLNNGYKQYKGNKKGNLFLNMYILKKDLLIELIKDSLIETKNSLFIDSIIQNKNLKIKAYPYQGYVGVIDSLQAYFKTNMDLLQKNRWQELFYGNDTIYSKVDEQAASKYTKTARVDNSLIANACIIEGKVKNSIIFSGVRVYPDAYISNSIIIKQSQIKEKAIVKNAILDKEVLINPARKLYSKNNNLVLIKKKAVI